MQYKKWIDTNKKRKYYKPNTQPWTTEEARHKDDRISLSMKQIFIIEPVTLTKNETHIFSQNC